MSPEAWWTVLVLVLAMALFISEKLPVDVVALIVLASLLLLGVVSPAQALSGFSSEATITVAAMFVLSAGIQRSGVLRSLGAGLARVRWPWLSTLLVMAVVGPVSAFVNNTAAVAVFLPLVLAASAVQRRAPSKILIPLSYAAQMGGVCTLIGTSTNLLVNSLVIQAGLPGFSLFEFSSLGLIMMAVGSVYLLVLGPWLLPDRQATEFVEALPPGSYATELRVRPESSLIGKSIESAGSGDQGVHVIALRRAEQSVPAPRRAILELGDVLLAQGDWSRLSEYARAHGLRVEAEGRDGGGHRPDAVIVEAMIAPNGRLAGHSLSELEFSRVHQATVLALQRRGEVLREKLRDLRLAVGDLLLMAVPPAELPALRRDAGLVVISEKEPERVSPRRALASVAIMAAVVAAATLGWLPIVASAILGCIALVVLRVLTPDEAYGAIDWRVIMLLAGVLPLGIAMRDSGLATSVVGTLMDWLGGHGPLVALAVIYLATAVLTEVMSNNATAVLLTPIAISTALALGVDPKPFLVAVMFAASTSFATPVGYQTNTMVYNAGGYRFSDFMRIGIPLNLLFWAMAVYFIPRFFPF